MNQQSSNPTAVVIVIGDEILSGRTRDANLAFIGSRCDVLGIDLKEARIIKDEQQTIIDTVNYYRDNVDYVFTTGGIGPTHDDITAQSIAKAFDVGLERNIAAVAAMNSYYPSGKLNEARLRMADMPTGANLIINPVSGAPGFQLENVFVLPGVPSIMQVMFDGLSDCLVGGSPVLTETVKTNIGEGSLAPDLSLIQDAYTDVSIGSYPFFSEGKIGVNLVLRSTNRHSVDEATVRIKCLVQELGGKLFGDGK